MSLVLANSDTDFAKNSLVLFKFDDILANSHWSVLILTSILQNVIINIDINLAKCHWSLLILISILKNVVGLC